MMLLRSAATAAAAAAAAGGSSCASCGGGRAALGGLRQCGRRHQHRVHLRLRRQAAALLVRCLSSFPTETAYSPEPVTEAAAVPVPLCRRPADHVELLSELLEWRAEVLRRIGDIKDAFAAADGGAGSSELQREVTWVLDDAVAAWREHEQQQQWVPCTWQQLDLELQTAARRGTPTDAWQVQLRARVQQLRGLWRLRLEERVPFQYLISSAHWRDLVLSVGPGVLVPRPETELLVDLAAAALRDSPALAARPWADLGTGSGALAIAAAALLERALDEQRRRQGSEAQQPQQQQQGQNEQGPPWQARVWAVDLSAAAAAYAEANAAACGQRRAVRVVRGSWFEPLRERGLSGRLGGLLSNPPYIPRAQMQGLQAEVGRHEPRSALDGGPGPGLDDLQVIVSGAADMLAPGGFLALETAGGEQALEVQRLLQRAVAAPQGSGGGRGGSGAGLQAFEHVAVHDDCFGVPRFVSATRAGGSAAGGGGS